jgi:hypothetical protein
VNLQERVLLRTGWHSQKHVIPHTVWRYRHWQVTLAFKKEDTWIGAFWKGSPRRLPFDLWVCLIPMLPIHLSVIVG